MSLESDAAAAAAAATVAALVPPVPAAAAAAATAASLPLPLARGENEPEVAILSPTIHATGNFTTISRIFSALDSDSCSKDSNGGCNNAKAQGGWRVNLISTTDPDAVNALVDRIRLGQVGCIIGLHAVRAGRILLAIQDQIDELKSSGSPCHLPPVCVIFGGTDINEMATSTMALDLSAGATLPQALSEGERKQHGGDEDYIMSCRKVMEACLRLSSITVCFAQYMKDKALTHFSGIRWIDGDLSDACSPITPVELVVVPQAVPMDIPISHDAMFSWADLFPSSQEDDFIFLLPSSIRCVKDPGFLIDAMVRIHSANPRVRLLIIGPVLDETFCQAVLLRAKDAIDAGAVYFGEPISHAQLLQAMCHSTAVVNSSISEGQCAALLEAMAIGVPVIARRNAGNESIIEHNRTGLLYTTPAEFEAVALGLLGPPDESPGSDSDLDMESMIYNAKKYIRLSHSVEGEAACYRRMVCRLLRTC